MGDLPIMVTTAPDKIYLQVADGGCDGEPFPENHEHVSWCEDSVMSDEVAYIRADLANPPAVELAEIDARVIAAFEEIGKWVGPKLMAAIEAALGGAK